MEAEPVLKVEGLKKYFRKSHGFRFLGGEETVKAVDGLSFSIPEGKTLALVGESGCGKSTTAKVILGLEKPTEGRVFLEGRDVHMLQGEQYRWYRRHMQAVFQDPWSSLNPRMRVRDIVAEPLRINRKDLSRQEIQERVHEVMNDCGLNPVQADRFPHEFSGGQRQRIAVAAALVSQPKSIILDEPVSALDVSIRAQVMNMFREIQVKYGVSYLLVAHDLGTTRYMADSIAAMYLGRIVEFAETEEFFENPSHPYTEALLSAALPSHPDIQRDEIILEGEVPSPINPPSGCPFHTRCPKYIGEICRENVPDVWRVSDRGHTVRCHLYREG